MREVAAEEAAEAVPHRRFPSSVLLPVQHLHRRVILLSLQRRLVSPPARQSPSILQALVSVSPRQRFLPSVQETTCREWEALPATAPEAKPGPLEKHSRRAPLRRCPADFPLLILSLLRSVTTAKTQDFPSRSTRERLRSRDLRCCNGSAR